MSVGRPMLGPSHPAYGQVVDATAEAPRIGGEAPAPQVSLPALPEIRRWVERTRQERAALQDRADRLREQFEPLRKQIAGVERSIKVLDHFLAQISVADSGEQLQPLRQVKPRPGGRLQDGQWSRKFDACRACGTTQKEHKAQGYCKSCYETHVHRAGGATAGQDGAP